MIVIGCDALHCYTICALFCFDGYIEMTTMSGDHGSPDVTAYMKSFDPVKEGIERIRYH